MNRLDFDLELKFAEFLRFMALSDWLNLAFFFIVAMPVFIVMRILFRTMFKKNRDIGEILKELKNQDVDNAQLSAGIAISHHEETLRQSKLAFTTSIVFAGVGALLIFSMVFVESEAIRSMIKGSGGAKDQIATNSGIDLNKLYSPILGGFIIEAVAALFFVQSQRANRNMATNLHKLTASDKFDFVASQLENLSDND